MVVSWFSRSPRCVALSLIATENTALFEGVREALFLHGVRTFIEPHVPQESLMVFEDNNEEAIKLAGNPICSTRSKQLDTTVCTIISGYSCWLTSLVNDVPYHSSHSVSLDQATRNT